MELCFIHDVILMARPIKSYMLDMRYMMGRDGMMPLPPTLPRPPMQAGTTT